MKQKMSRKNRFNPLQRFERNLRYSFSCMLSLMFSPNHTKIYSWRFIIGTLALLAFCLFMLSLSY